MSTTTKSLELLNKARNYIVSFANENRIDLRTVFPDAETFQRFVIGICFRTLTENGVETSEAFDMLLGDGAFRKLSDSIWEHFQPVA